MNKNKFEDKAIAKVQDRMVEREKELVAELVNEGKLNPDSTRFKPTERGGAERQIKGSEADAKSRRFRQVTQPAIHDCGRFLLPHRYKISVNSSHHRLAFSPTNK